MTVIELITCIRQHKKATLVIFVSIDSGKNSICIYWHARCWDV